MYAGSIKVGRVVAMILQPSFFKFSRVIVTRAYVFESFVPPSRIVWLDCVAAAFIRS